jgi:hypothetical protein
VSIARSACHTFYNAKQTKILNNEKKKWNNLGPLILATALNGNE